MWQVVHAEATDLPTRPGVLMPSLRCSLLVVALHAAHHGPSHERSTRDLQQALRAVPTERWASVEDLAGRLGAREALSAGLRLLPDGRRTADALGLSPPRSRRILVRAAQTRPSALGWDELFAMPSPRARIGFLRHVAFPSRTFLEHRYPMARRSGLGVVLARVWRPLHLTLRAPRALVHLRQLYRRFPED